MIEDIQDIERLKRINKVLMERVENDTNHQGNSFSLFQTALSLEAQVRRRTDELSATLARLEKMNRELAQAKEIAEEANRSKTRFLAAAGHDVLQPLNAALLSMSLLEDQQQTPAGKRLVDQIGRSLSAMEELLRTLLDISKFDAGVVKPNYSTISLKNLLQSLDGTLAPTAEAKGLRLRIRKRDINLRTDNTMLRRILQNLISNAIRYTDRGGIVVGIRKFADGIGIDVIDSGCGIAPGEQTAIFEEFHRGKNQTKDTPGFGLGLSIVRRMVDSLGYGLTIKSRPGKGSRFRLFIPNTANTRPGKITQEIKPQTPAKESLEGRRILLIENDMALSEAMTALLKSWQVRVSATASIEETMNIILDQGFKPELVIADQHLDNGDLGTSAIAAIRALSDDKIPALVVTANPSQELEYIAGEMGAELMQKPVKPAQLRALVSHMLASRNENM